MEGQLGPSELFIIPWVSAIEQCSLSGVPLHTFQEQDAMVAQSGALHMLAVFPMCECTQQLLSPLFSGNPPINIEEWIKKHSPRD